MKKTILSLLIIAFLISLSVFAVTAKSNQPQNKMTVKEYLQLLEETSEPDVNILDTMTEQAYDNYVEKQNQKESERQLKLKKAIIDGKVKLEECETVTESQEEKEIMEKKFKESERNAKIKKEYITRTVKIINKCLNTDDDVSLEFDHTLMQASVDAVKSGKLTSEELIIVKGYIDEMSCAVLSDDPLRKEISQILS